MDAINFKLKRITQNMSASIVGKLITMVFGIILPKLYIDKFGSEINGLISSINGIFIYINLLEAGIGSASTQALFKPFSSKDQNSINSILTATKKYYAKAGIYSLAVISFLTFLYPATINSGLDYWLIVELFLITAISFLTKFFIQGKYVVLLNADNRAYILSNTFTLFQVISSLAKITLILLDYNVVTVQLVFSLIIILQAFSIRFYVKKKYPELNINTLPDYSAIAQKSAVMVQQIATIILNSTDVLLLSFFGDLKLVSVYVIYNSVIFSQLLFIPQALTDAITGSLGHAFAENKHYFKRMYCVYENLFLLLSFTFLTVALLLTTPFLMLYTKNITDINYIDQWLPLLFFIMSLLNALRTSNYLPIHVAGKFTETKKSSIIEAAINLFFSLIFVNIWGIRGVVIGSIIALIYRVLQLSIFVNREILNRSYRLYFRKLIINIVPMVLIVCLYLFQNILIENYIEFLIVGILLVFISLILILVSNYIFNEGFGNYITKYIKKK